ncbi:LuxR C-terminal-related transcriptional regulator [Streptomyces sp. CB01201]|uniref:LuxR C-terminal-related transcriptional regulator n=1 Tax=Streptomyces sp. CB01201 TaxID=2020324 RepID=UPI00131C6F53|nr:LuxR C-terminal-related transcriptional regulator [Streptomyces sp. CB01201]
MRRQLTAQQREVLWLRAQGLSGPQIARHLSLAVSTIDYRERCIVHALDAANITNAVHLATAEGLIGRYADCGDRAAYLRHWRRGEIACPACKAANARRQAERRAATQPPPVTRELTP